jgi:uncharacterized coiled-coil protein SlyX
VLRFANGLVEIQHLLVALISSLQAVPASRFLLSKTGSKNLFHDLLRLNSAVTSDKFDIDRIRTLLNAVLNKQPDAVIWDAIYDAITELTPPPRPTSSFLQTPWLRSTGSFANSTEHRKYVDNVLKKELGPMYVRIPGYFKASFEEVANLQPAAQAVFQRCCEGDNPLY